MGSYYFVTTNFRMENRQLLFYNNQLPDLAMLAEASSQERAESYN